MGRKKKVDTSSSATITLTLAELDKLMNGDKKKEKLYTYKNYAPFPVTVLNKGFEKRGEIGQIRDDITESDLTIIKKAGFIQKGYLGEDSETPVDGSYSDKMLESISKLDFEKYTASVDRIFGIVTLQRLLNFVQTSDSAKYEKYCLNRITELEVMELGSNESIPENIITNKDK